MGPDDPTDPFVTAEAAALNQDPNQIYAFVRDQVKFEAYPGSLRGARGTLWAMAGNTLDKASLLVALLQASGYTTQYEHTTLNSTQTGSQALVNLNRSMFPQATILLGCIPTSALTDDPGRNSYATSWSNDYYWVEYGPGNIALDPNIPGGQPGQTVQAPDSSFATVPQTLQQQVTVSIIAETYSQASGLFGFGPAQNTVLTQTFYTWQLVGNILSAGNIVQSTVTGGFDLSATTFTYTPYLLIGSEGADVSQDTIVTGTAYQEFFTNFPLSSIVLTGLFVQVQANNAFQQQQQTYIHTMFDRIGPAVRQGNSSAQITLPTTLAPAVTDFDIATLNILPTRVNVSAAFQAQQTRINTAYQNYENIKPALQALPTNGTPLTAAQQVVAQQAANLSKYLLITVNELVTMAYDGAADQLAAELDTVYYTRIYPSAPRITVANSSTDAAGDALYSLDVLKNDMFVIDGLYQNTMTPYYEEVARGMIESTMEANILSSVTGVAASDIGTVMGALGDPTQLLWLGPGNFNAPSGTNQLESTSLSADAQTLILDAVNAGDLVVTPNQMVTINGATAVGWWETDQFGHTVSHFPNGGHAAFQEAAEWGAATIFSSAYNGLIAKLIGYVEGIGVTGYAFAAATLEAVAQNAPFINILKNTKDTLEGLGVGTPQQKFFTTLVGDLNTFLDLALHESVASKFLEGPSLIAEFFDGLMDGIEDMEALLKSSLGKDPEILTFLSTPLAASLPGVTPGATPGVTVSITTDQTFTMPYNGNELPVYDVTVTNTGPATDTFSFQAVDNSGNYTLGIGYPGPGLSPLLTLQPGQAGEVNLCVLPAATLPAVGNTGMFQVTATGQTSGISGSTSTNYSVPVLPVLSLTSDPQVVSMPPGGTVSATITLGSLGNAGPGAVSLTASTQPAIAVNGLTTPVSVPLNGVITEPLTFTAAANAVVNGTYYVAFTASYSTPSGGPQSVQFTLPVTVQALGTCTANASLTAQQTNATTLSNTFAALDFDMNAAAQTPTNAAIVSRIGGDLTILETALSNVPYLQSFVAGVTSAGSAVAAATPTALLSALNGLDAAICPIGTAMSEASSYNVQISLTPNSLVAGPNSPATFQVALYNPQSTMKVYNLTVTGVPAGVTALFNQSTVTLTPNEATVNTYQPITLTLTPGASFTAPFTFNVVATPVGAPEFAISAPGSLLVRPQAVSIDQVTLTPPYGPPGTQFAVTARVFAEVNQSVYPVSLVAQLNNASGPITYDDYESSYFSLTPTTTLQTIAIGTFDSTNLPDGPYTVSVTALGFSNIPFNGSSATGSFLVGAPLTATLTANANSTPPATVPPGSSAVQVALNITRDTSVQNPISTLVESVQLKGISKSMALYQNGPQQLAYACSDSYVNIVDVTNPAQMQVLGTFANSLLTTENGNPVAGFQVVACNTYNNNLILSYSRYDGNTTPNPIPTHFAVFSLANPLSPAQVGSVVDIQRPDSLGLYVAGNTALMYQSTTFYDPVDSVVYQETGDVWAGDLSNASSTGAVSYLNDIYSCGGTNPSTGNCNNTTTVQVGAVSGGVCTTTPTQVPNDPYEGGPYRIGPGTAVNSTTTYFASTSASGGNVENPGCPTLTGQLLVVDTSTPSNPKLVTSVSDPAMAFMTGVAIQGNLAIAVGDSLGVFTNNSGYVGTLVISAFDISTPQSPMLVSSITTQLSDSPGSLVVALGNSTFAVGNTSLNGNGILVLVDASNPSALRYMPYSAVLVANPTVAENGYFFALSATPAAAQNALSAFQLSEITGPQVTVSLQLPNTGNAAVDPTSFSLAPSSVTTGATYNTYVWNQPSPNTITFNVNVSNVNPGDVPTVVVGGQMAYTLPTLGPGTFVLPAVTVLCQQIVTISPTTNSVSSGGSTATYMVTVSNPTATTQTFVLSTLGIPSSWGVSAPAGVTVAGGSNQTFNLMLTPSLNATPNATYNFFVFLSTAGGITASVGASLYVSELPSANASNNTSASYSSFTANLNPAAITIGQGGTGMFQVAITNTGSSTARFTLPTPNPNVGWTLNFTPSTVLNILPGLSNAATVTGQITVPTGTTAGSYPVTIQVVQSGQTENLSLTVNVVAAGVTASISPGAGNPTTSFSLHLSNVGSVADTYNLSLQGALIEAASIQSTSGPIPAGQSAQIPITLKPVNFVTPGSYTLQIQAVSQANPAVVAFATAIIQVSGSQSVSAVIKPSPASVPTTPATAPLILQVTNTGNTPDNYTAAITNISSNVTANLNGAQSVPAFPIPALSTAVIPLNATLNTGKSGSVTVTVTSTSNMSETAQASVTIGAGSPCDVNQDGKTNIVDVQIMVDEALGTDAPNNDLSGDGVVNVVDIQIDINAVLMLGCEAGTVNVTSVKPKSHGATLSQSAAEGASLGVVARPANIVDLGTLGGNSSTAFGLNDLGQIVGSSDTGQRAIHAFLWEAGRMTDLDSSDARSSAAYSINNAVQIAGVYFARDRDTSGFLYSVGKVTVLSQAPHGRASGINNAGQIVGDLATEPASPRQAFLWNAGAVVDLGTLGGVGSEARAINDSGQIAGSAHLDGGSLHAFLYSGTGLTDLGTLGGKNSTAYGIDNAGEVVGASQTAENGVQHAFLYRQGAMTDLGTLGGNESQANGINDSGWIVGWSRTAGDGQRAFVWRTGRMVDLNSLISAGPGIWLEEAIAINAAGQIVANASNGHAYLISLPVELR